MRLERKEHNVSTGESETIEMIAYRNDDGDVIVLDAIDPTPVGYVAFDPYSEPVDKR